ncbi:hypothetical protein PI124_g10794 [Phytophthora idaei]|nr:hypothetical protein PI125_g8408 [Phytophthora idaei]KAG3156613.1 hypothetical protein PI126_g8690 [Phytophthora idaei]KAG3244449.1 hypothetical protein PI124_g10794 [Phytophthora idaei]
MSSESGYPEHHRRNQGRTTLRKDVELDNRRVVPYNPYPCEKYNCHINVEICSTINAIKYTYKYVYKGPDRATLMLDTVKSDLGDSTTRRIDIN